jgi:prokaryotic ubiquitin-like protein Pup
MPDGASGEPDASTGLPRLMDARSLSVGARAVRTPGSTVSTRRAEGYPRAPLRFVDRVGDMAQEQKQPRKSSQEETATEEVVDTDVAERKEVLDDDVDAILDEIDDVLETNAEDFVKSFIQKGGQ